MATQVDVQRQLRQRALLRQALRDGDVLTAARVWERLRVDPFLVTRQEAAAAREARAAVGRAIRDARWRREHAIKRSETATEIAPRRTGIRAWRVVATAVAIGAAIGLLFATIPPAPIEYAPAAAAPEEATSPDQATATRAPLLGGRGRTTATLPPVVLATVEPEPDPTATPAPTATAAPTVVATTTGPARSASPGGVPGGQPGGVPGGVPSGTPGGVVGGVPGGTGTATPSPSPSVNVLPPSPTPLVAGMFRIQFTVLDSRTGQPLPNVCVIYGTLECKDSDPHTNATGLYWLDLPVSAAKSVWTFSFTKPGYITTSGVTPRTSTATSGTIVRGTVYLRRR